MQAGELYEAEPNEQHVLQGIGGAFTYGPRGGMAFDLIPFALSFR